MTDEKIAAARKWQLRQPVDRREQQAGNWSSGRMRFARIHTAGFPLACG